MVVLRCCPELSHPKALPEPMGLLFGGTGPAGLLSPMLALRSISSRTSVDGVDEDATRGVVVELFNGRSTFMGRLAAGLGYVDAAFDEESAGAWEVDVDRQELPQTPELDLETGVEYDFSLPVVDLESSVCLGLGNSMLERGVGSWTPTAPADVALGDCNSGD